ncbi:MAG: phenylacetate--CoA ligase family protein, partial [Gemmataceae bacterium]
MLATFLNRHLLQPLLARKRQSRHLHYLHTLEQTQFDSPTIIAARQLGTLRRLLHHCYTTVPYYRRTWDECGLRPTDVRQLSDLRQFPILTKADIRAHGPELLSTAFDARTLLTKKTSGSTGVPLVIRIDEAAKQFKYATTLRSDQWSGWRRGEAVAKIWGNPEYHHEGWRGQLRNRFIDRAIHLDTIRLTPDRIRQFHAELTRHRPGLVFGHAHSLYLVAEEFRRAGLTPPRP